MAKLMKMVDNIRNILIKEVASTLVGIIRVLENITEKKYGLAKVTRVKELMGMATTILKEVQEPASLLHMALKEVVEEGLEVGELSSTLRAMVEEWPTRSKEETRRKVVMLQAGPGKALVQGLKDL